MGYGTFSCVVLVLVITLGDAIPPRCQMPVKLGSTPSWSYDYKRNICYYNTNGRGLNNGNDFPDCVSCAYTCKIKTNKKLATARTATAQYSRRTFADPNKPTWGDWSRLAKKTQLPPHGNTCSEQKRLLRSQ